MHDFTRVRECVCERTNVMFYFMHVMYTHTGPQGEKGELGPTGPPGLPGEKGARGKQGKRVSFSEVLRRTTTDQIDRANHSVLTTAHRIDQLSIQTLKRKIPFLAYRSYRSRSPYSVHRDPYQRTYPRNSFLKLLCDM